MEPTIIIETNSISNTISIQYNIYFIVSGSSSTGTIRYDTIEEFNVDSSAEYPA